VTEVVTTIDIAAPPERVWALAMDPDCLSDWVTIHRRLHGHDGGALRKGYAMEQTLHLRGVNFKVHWELVACEEGRHAEWHGRGPARSHAETEYRLTAVDGGTRFDYRNSSGAKALWAGGQPRWWAAARREADASLHKLKALSERP
jgi:hypothetical protein